MQQEKSLSTLLYILKYENSRLKIWAIMYLADKLHLSEWGRPINFNEIYVRTEGGIAPIIAVETIESFPDQFFVELAFDRIYPYEEPNLDFLSESDIECLNQSISSLKDKPISQVLLAIESEEPIKNRSYGEIINWEDIILSLSNGDEVWGYINS